MNTTNRIWDFFASVKLAIFTLSTIAITSIIGTVVLQNQPEGYYISRYGEAVARLIFIMDIQDMYYSWWFIMLLGLLVANITICSIDRFPPVWKQIRMDQTSFTPDRLAKMAFNQTLPQSVALSEQDVTRSLSGKGFSVQCKEIDSGQLLAGQKGGWTRTGVYIVHLSILVIFAGAIMGHFLGFKGSVMLPESESTGRIHNSKEEGMIDLGFEVRCDFFEIQFYRNGMPKEYLSRLTIIENGKEIRSQEIEVNAPLKHRGVTFYQASYQPFKDTFVITVSDPGETALRSFVAPFQKEVEYKERELVFGILSTSTMQDRLATAKVWIKEGDKDPKTVTVAADQKFQLEEGGTVFRVKQMYATGLQVAKDPGVWLVYLGCFMMLFGLYVAFFMSHRRIWILLPKDKSQDILLAGAANKNKIGFEKTFDEIRQLLATTAPSPKS